MTDRDMTLAPGCYGQAITFRTDVPECAGCPFKTDCVDASTVNLRSFQLSKGFISEGQAPAMTLVPKPYHPAPPPAPPAPPRTSVHRPSDLIDTLPPLAREQVQKFQHIPFQAAFAAGRNPIGGTSHAYMRVACHLLLKLSDRGVDKPLLKEAIGKALQVEEPKALAFAALAFHVLPALGAAENVNGRLILKRG